MKKTKVKNNIKTQNISDIYKPYETIVFCNNTFNNITYLIDDNGVFPLLIGKGEFPRIWLYTRNNNNPIALVRDNISISAQVKVNIYQEERRMTIELFDMKDKYLNILEIVLKEGIPNLKRLDMRPIGYNIYGDSESLNIGNSKFANNVFQGMRTLIHIDNKNTPQK